MSANGREEQGSERMRKRTDFEAAALTREAGVVREFLYFLRNSKKWWLLPILVVLLLFSGLMLLSGTAVAPFIYTLF